MSGRAPLWWTGLPIPWNEQVGSGRVLPVGRDGAMAGQLPPEATLEDAIERLILPRKIEQGSAVAAALSPRRRSRPRVYRSAAVSWW
ncbi:MAG: hypothetical protein ACREL4_02855 [Gemmatimonadales bacterium]